MKCICNVTCKYIKDIDMFGKEPQLYYKREAKKTSWMGRIFSILFVVVYIAFLIYKLIRMLRKTDVTFYDTFTYSPEPSKIKVTNENFYGGFALEDPNSYDPYIDEGIYIPKASFRRAERKGDKFAWNIVDLELEPCKIEKFGSSHQEKFKTKTLNNLYCFKNMDFILEGHFSYDLYSFFYIQFFPCVNSTENQNCKPLEIIDHYLKNTFISFQWQDIELTPKNYSYPVRPRDVDIYTSVGKKLFQEIHTYFQVVNIETDIDFVGFDEFENFKTDTFIKYDEMIIMSNIIETDIYETGESFCDFTMKLSENIRVERRTYTKLITILGDVGGLMEVVFTVFRVFCSLSVDILYDISLVNNLFSFDLDKKVIKLKEKNNQIKKQSEDKSKNKSIILENEKPKIFSPIKPRRHKSSRTFLFRYSDKSVGTGNRLNEDTTKNNRISSNNDSLLVVKFENKKPKHNRNLNYERPNLGLYDNDTIKNKNLLSLRQRNFNKINEKDELNEVEYTNNITNEESDSSKGSIVNKIKITRACVYLCFCFARKRNIIQNVLLNEGMSIINDKLDIFNIFDKLYRDEKIHEKLMRHEVIEMTDETKAKLRSIYNKSSYRI